MIEIFAIKLTADDLFVTKKEGLLKLLPSESQEAVLRHKTIKGAQRTLLGDLLSRKLISTEISKPIHEIHYKKSIKGKPYLDNLPIHFNISHSGEWVVLAIGDIDVGIDVEVLRAVNYRVATRFFSKEENDLLKQLNGNEKLKLFFDFWTIKESYLKLLGTGLTKSLSSFSIIRDGENFKLKENTNNKHEPVFFRQYNLAADYKLSVCSYQNNFANDPMIIQFDELPLLNYSK